MVNCNVLNDVSKCYYVAEMDEINIISYHISISLVRHNTIYRRWTGLVRENIYLYDVNVSTCLVVAYEDYNCFGDSSLFRAVEGFKMEQKSTD
jgi:hypothetical protein